MRFNKAFNFRKGCPLTLAGNGKNRSLAQGWRQLAPLLLTFFLAACSSNTFDKIDSITDSLNPFKAKENEANRGTIGFVEGFLGGVAVDEPRASLVGRDILSSGGSAADVAVAVSFALSVTLPSSASLGGGGVCVVHDAESNTTESLDFLPAVPKRISARAVRPVAVPGTVRGLALLHAKYGRLPWSQLVSPAESLARFGNQVSRAFASDLDRIPPAMKAAPGILRIFGLGQGGRLIREGDFLKQLDLSAVLSRIRTHGAGDFYTGLTGRRFAAAVAKAGGGLSLNDLRSYTPRWRPTLEIPYVKSTQFHFPISAGPSGVLMAQMIGMLIENGDWENASPAERKHLMAEIASRAFSYRKRWLRNGGGNAVEPAKLVSEESIKSLIAGFREERHTPGGTANSSPGAPPGNSTGTGFVVVDREGSAVACGLTLNNLFGVGRAASDMGIILAALPGPGGRGPDSLAPMLLISKFFNVFYFGAAASGGPVASSALAGVTAGTLLGRTGESLEGALNAKRVHNNGDPDLTYFEQGMTSAVVEDLSKRGHRLSPTESMGLVNAIFCPTGVPSDEVLSCEARVDPRGFGLAAGAE